MSVHVPPPTKVTTPLFETVHVVDVLEVADVLPLPVYAYVGVNVPPYTALVGMLLMLMVGVAWLMLNDWGLPVAAAEFTVAVECAVRVHVPSPTNVTRAPETVQVAVVLEVTEVVPSPEYA